MKLCKVPAFEIRLPDRHDISADNERLTFRTLAMAEKTQAIIGGTINSSFIYQESKE